MIFSKRQENVLWHLEKNPLAQIVGYFGNALSGKTFLGCAWQIERRKKYPKTKGAICRKELSTLMSSTYETFCEVHEMLYRKSMPYDFDGKRNIIKFYNGSKIFLKALAHKPGDMDFDKGGGFEVGDIYVDEGGEVPEIVFWKMWGRIRGKSLINNRPVMLVTGNPSLGWPKTTFKEDKYGDPVKLPKGLIFEEAWIHDNPNKKKVETYLKSFGLMPQYEIERMLKNNWNYMQGGDPFLPEFNRNKHVVDNTFIIGNYELLASFDFNVNPTTCLFMQLTNKGIFIHREFMEKGGTENLCEHVKPHIHNQGGFIVTGDMTGKYAKSSSQIIGGDLASDFTIIKHKLGISDFQLKNTMKVNPLLKHSRTLCNYIFKNFPVYINKECVNLLHDIKTAKIDEDEKLFKDDDKNGNHLLDCMRYGFNVLFPGGTEQIDRFKLQLGL